MSQPVEVAQERPEVPGHAVVGVVPQQFPTQRDALLSYRVMPMVLTPKADAPQATAKAIARRLLHHDPAAFPRPSPIEREAQQVEATTSLRSRLWRRLTWRRRCKAHQPCLVRVKTQAVLAESLRQHFLRAAGILLRLEDQHEVGSGKSCCAPRKATYSSRASVRRKRGGSAESASSVRYATRRSSTLATKARARGSRSPQARTARSSFRSSASTATSSARRRFAGSTALARSIGALVRLASQNESSASR